MKLEMNLARRADQREEWRAEMERERLDLERERFEEELGRRPERRRTVRDRIQTVFGPKKIDFTSTLTFIQVVTKYSWASRKDRSRLHAT